MAEQRKGMIRFVLWLFVFAVGFGTGYYVRDRQQHEKLREAVQKTRQEAEQAALGAIDRAKRAGGDLRGGAQAAAESTKSAFRELVRD